MSLKKYKDALVASKEENEKSLAPARAAQESAKLGIKIAELDLQVQTEQNTIAALATNFPLPVDEILEAQNELALNKRELEQLTALQNELFGS